MKINATRTIFLSAIVSLSHLLLLSPASAKAAAVCSGQAHTTHSVSVNQRAVCVVTKTFEPQNFCLVDGKGQNIDGQEFVVTPGQPATFGMSLLPSADFNMEYTLTCVAADGRAAQSPKVMIAVGADSPGHPNIVINKLYGAQALMQASHGGGDFSITF